MKIIGVEGMSNEEIQKEIRNGGRFVIFQYCISILVMTFKRSSGIYFIKDGESAFSKGFVFTLISVLLGWWGFPWGPIYTLGSLKTNLMGGKDVTEEVMDIFDQNTELEAAMALE